MPGAAIPAGWTTASLSSPAAVSQAVTGAMTGGGGGVNSSGQLVNASGAVVGTANPKDLPGYTPGTLPGDKVSAPTPQPQTQPQDPAKPAPTTPPPTTPVPATPPKPVLPGQTTTGGTVTTGSATSPAQTYTTPLQGLKQSGVPVPQMAGAGMAGVAAAMSTQPQQQSASPAVTTFMDSNPLVSQTSQQLLDFLSPQSTRDTLSQYLGQVSADRAELSGLKLELMNNKRIISGTEQDIRDEVTKSNGFATESQVQALALARNKTLIQRNAQLTDLIGYQKDIVDTDTQLLSDQKQLASQEFSQRMSLLNYQQENNKYVLDAARDTYKTLMDKAPESLYSTLLNDPTQAQRFTSITGVSVQALAGMSSASYEVVKGGQDAFGNPLPDKIFNKKTGKFVSGGYAGTVPTTPFGSTSGGTGGAASNQGPGIIGSGGANNGLSFDQYGLLANTNFKPGNMVDQLAQKYIDQYTKNGTVPTASSLGRNMKPEAMAQVDARARELYFQATGMPLPNPEILKGYQKIITSNNQFANNLSVQEQTVKSNFGLNLENLQKSDLNSSNINAINTFLDNVKQYWLGNPDAAQYALQNSTIQNEIGSLLAVRNASGTTVHDKLVSAGLVPKGASLDQQKAILVTLMQEADNAKSALSNATGDLYKQVDPLVQDPNNPVRSHMQVENALNRVGASYKDVISKTPKGQIPVIDNKTGKVGYIAPNEFNSSYTKL